MVRFNWQFQHTLQDTKTKASFTELQLYNHLDIPHG